MSGLSSAMHAPDAPPPDRAREYALCCNIIEATVRTWRNGHERDNAKRLREFYLATQYLIESNTLRINGE